MINRVYGLALHHYTENLSFGDPAKNGWDARKGPALGFSIPEWYESSRKPTGWRTCSRAIGP